MSASQLEDPLVSLYLQTLFALFVKLCVCICFFVLSSVGGGQPKITESLFSGILLSLAIKGEASELSRADELGFNWENV